MRHPAAPQAGSSARGASPALSVVILGALVLMAALAIARLFVPPSTPVQTSARLACERPSEHETLLVYVNASSDGAVRVECGPAVTGPRSRR